MWWRLSDWWTSTFAPHSATLAVRPRVGERRLSLCTAAQGLSVSRQWVAQCLVQGINQSLNSLCKRYNSLIVIEWYARIGTSVINLNGDAMGSFPVQSSRHHHSVAVTASGSAKHCSGHRSAPVLVVQYRESTLPVTFLLPRDDGRCCSGRGREAYRPSRWARIVVSAGWPNTARGLGC